ncbi:c-type cytochrome [Blastococcus montanus]|uniref:c-type cytochrome n=1 Tax=Blastococcus montanus TaxID=3144973 RepID=UPI0032084BDC
MSARRPTPSPATPTAARARSRLSRWVLVSALVLACAGLTLVTAPVEAAPAPEQPAESVTAGAAAYQRFCGVCHNNDGSGIPGTGVEAGPDLRGLPVAYVDLVIRTARMPIVHRPVGAVEEELTDAQRVAVVDWMTDAFELEGGIPEVAAGDPGRGQPLWLTNCAPCHSAAGNGGISADGTIAPEVTDVDATGIVEALRVGPFEMPRFGDEVLSEQDAADIAAYVQELSDAETTPLGLSDIGRVYGGAFTGLLALAMVGALLVVARNGRRPAVGPEEAQAGETEETEDTRQ